ncbi:MAG TPA: PQQ-binding-like beta-propeller repeat protein [Bacillota bacterium]|nr:PQQ-binding-like beta-propeller repeat protein [Bacillota bacterium]
MRPRRRRLYLNFIAACVLLPFLAACSVQGATVDESGDAQPVVVDVTTLPAPVTAPAPLWQKTYDAPIQLSLAPDGSGAAVLGPDGLSVLGRDGSSLWKAAAGGVAFALRDGLVVRGPAPTDASGTIAAYDASGDLLWQKAATGPITAAGSADGSRVAVADDGAGVVWLIDTSPADAPAHAHSIQIAGPASLQFTANDQLVIDDGTQVSVVSPSGKVAALCPGGCSGPSRAVAPARDAAWLAVATRGGDNTLYMFKSDGTALWNRALPGGGGNGLAVGPGDRQVLLYNAGTAGGLIDVATSTGAERWAISLQEAGAPLQAVAAAFRADGGLAVLAQNAMATYVVGLDASGQPQTALPLPTGVSVGLSGPRNAAVVATDNTTGTASVSWYGLQASSGD